MREREAILAELWKRMSAVTGCSFTARNPVSPPNLDDLPAIQIFELGDVVEQVSMRGGYPGYKRKLTVVIEPFVVGSTEAAASKELGTFVQNMKRKLYEGGADLGRRCQLTEVDASRVHRPGAGDNIAGIGIAVEIRYIEDISQLF